MFTIASVNVAGLRGSTITGKGPKSGNGLQQWFDPLKLDILSIQETKATMEQSTKSLELLGINPSDYHLLNDQYRKGHAGISIWANPKTVKVNSVNTPLENHPLSEQYSFSGRYLELDVTFNNQPITIINSYWHHADSPTLKLMDGSLIDRDKSIHSMNSKHIFLDALFTRLKELLNQGKEFIIMGDFNIAHTDIDIKNFSGNKTKAGFLPEERAWLDLMFTASLATGAKEVYTYNKDIDYHAPKTKHFNEAGLGLIDVCREQWNDERIYTWWSNRGRAFDNDAGWRIDYQVATPKLAATAKSAEVQRQDSFLTRYSDHAPVVVSYDL
jgi:exodeoxyribonuclease-3